MFQHESNNRQWLATSIFLLAVYLSFFHLCLNAEYWQCNILGIACWLVWAATCHIRKSVFLNRFEYWIHQFVGVDILLEGFSPLHTGFGFYYCAAGFWCVFLAYRFIGARRASGNVGKAGAEMIRQFLTPT